MNWSFHTFFWDGQIDIGVVIQSTDFEHCVTNTVCFDWKY